MTEKLRQSLSAAMDDEADAFELRRVIDELGRDSELRSLWDRYHLIGSVLRGDRVPVPADLRDRVWAALEVGVEEGDAVAPPVIPEANVPPATAVAAAPRSYLGRYTGLAVAASVAFGVVLGFNGIWDDGDIGSSGLIASDTAGVVAGPPSTAVPDAAPSPMSNEISAIDVQRSQAYMLHHTQQQALNQTGVMSFVKLATYEAP